MKKATLDSLVSGGKVKLITSDCAVANASALFACFDSASMNADAMTAYGKGCRAFISASPLSLPKDATVGIADRDAIIAYALRLHPIDGVRFVSVRAERGTTTLGLYLASLMTNLGEPSAFIDANGAVLGTDTTAFIGDRPIELIRYVSTLVKNGVKAIVVHGDSSFADCVECDRLPIAVADVTKTYLAHGAPFSSVIVGRETYELPYTASVASVVASAVSYARSIGFGEADVRKAARISYSRGRMQALPSTSPCIIDSARTKSDISFVIGEVMPLYRSVTVVIGSVGGCHTERRREIADAINDSRARVILTSDDPCFENPRTICEEIKSYLSSEIDAEIIVDRKTAISKAVAGTDGCVLILGKGYENYDEIGLRKLPYSDEDAVKEINKTTE